MQLYKKIRETNDIDDWYIELYEKFPCNDKQELHKREGEVIREISNLNRNVAGRSYKEYRYDNKEKIKQYYENNKEKVKQCRENNKEKIANYEKQYREENKEKLDEYYKQWNAQKIKCECGSRVRRNGISRHRKSKKHLDWQATQAAASN